MYRPPAHAQRGFFYGLAQRRVCVAGAGEVFAAGAEFDGVGAFRNQIPRAGADDVHAGDAVADRVDAFGAGGEMRVDGNAPALVELDFHGGGVELVGVRNAADGQQHLVALEGLGAFAFDDAAALAPARGGDFAFQAEV